MKKVRSSQAAILVLNWVKPSFFLWVSLSVTYAHFVSKENLFVLCSLLNDWNYFWNKYCNFAFLAICCSLFPLSIFLPSSWYQKAKTGLWMSLRNKKMINYHIKGVHKLTCYKTKANFSQFFFSDWLLHKCFFSFLIKAFANFEKLIRYHWQDFIVYQYGVNFEMLIEIFCPKLVVFNVIFGLFRSFET